MVHVSRRDVIRNAGAIVTATGLAGRAAADGSTDRKRRIIGTETRRGAKRAKRQADRVIRELDFGDVGCAVVGEFSPAEEKTVEIEADVRYTESEVEVEALGEMQSIPWGVDRIGADAASFQGRTGRGAHIAVLDTGIDSDHPDLGPNLGEGYAIESCEDECDYDWDDDHDHGTHCAGIAGAAWNDRGVVGVSPDATLHSVKVLSGDGSGDASGIAEGLAWVVEQGYDVASMSIGSTSTAAVVEDAVEYAYRNGVLLVAAAGNEEPSCDDCFHYPAGYPEVVAVGAVNDGDEVSEFSITDEEVELVAPGSDIRSTVRGGYDTFSGTSMATPHVAGAGALLMAQGHSNTDARTRLRNTAEDLGLDEDEQGSGLVDVDAALGVDEGSGGGDGRGDGDNEDGNGNDDGNDHRDEEVNVATGMATDVGATTARLRGYLTELGEDLSATVGFEYWIEGQKEDTLETAEREEVFSADEFSATVDGLWADTTYAFAAFAVTDETRVTGTVREFTTREGADGPFGVATYEPTGVGESEATLHGLMYDPEDIDEVDAYFEYWIEGQKEDTLEREHATDLENPGEFTETVDDLEADTEYVVVAGGVSEDDDREVRGDPVEFRTTAPFSVVTGEPTDVDEDEAELNGRITDMRGTDEIDAYFEYWVEDERDDTAEEVSAEEIDHPDDFEEDAEDLHPGTTYVVVARGEADGDVILSGDPVEFTTEGEIEEHSRAVVTEEPTDIDEDEAELKGRVATMDGADEIDAYFEYWVAGQRDDTAEEVFAEEVDEPDDFDEDVEDLDPGTTYVVVARGEADGDEILSGDPVEFTTGI